MFVCVLVNAPVCVLVRVFLCSHVACLCAHVHVYVLVSVRVVLVPVL